VLLVLFPFPAVFLYCCPLSAPSPFSRFFFLPPLLFSSPGSSTFADAATGSYGDRTAWHALAHGTTRRKREGFILAMDFYITLALQRDPSLAQDLDQIASWTTCSRTLSA